MNVSTQDGAGRLPPPTAEPVRPPADLAVQPKPKRPTSKNVRTSGGDTRPPEGRTSAAALRVLLIEDEFPVAESLRRQLEFEGLRVDVAPDGESGLALARSQSYDVILLDRRLRPGMSGDQVLEHLHHDGDPTPVLILTGYPDVASAFQAGRLRAAGYLEKGRLSGAELAVAVRRAAGTVEVRTGKALPLFIAQGLGASPCIAELLRHLDRMEAAAPSGPDNAPVDAQTRLLKVLAQAAANRDLTVLEFTAAANALRLLSSRSLAWSVTVRRIREELAEASRRTAFQLEPKVERVLSHIEAAGSNWSDVTEQQVAAEHDVDVATVWRWLDRQVGLTFPRCRRLVVMRRVVLQLTETDEHVRQIAFRVGYVDHSRLDHEFDASFGLTPTGFRRLQ